MKINLQGKNLEITESIRDYVEKRVTNLGKVLNKIIKKGGEVFVNFEVSKTTNHHKTGEFFEAQGNVEIDGKNFTASSLKENLYEAIDEVKVMLFNKINHTKDRNQTLFTRGARSVKKMLKGLSNRKP